MIGRRSVLEPKGADSDADENGHEEETKERMKRKRKSDEMGLDDSKDESIEEGEADTTGSSNGTKSLSPEVDADDKFNSPKKRKTIDLAHGTSFTEILGTPIVVGQASGSSVPDLEKFSDGICPHKPYEMDAQTPMGSYKNIVKLTREFNKSQTDN